MGVSVWQWDPEIDFASYNLKYIKIPLAAILSLVF